VEPVAERLLSCKKGRQMGSFFESWTFMILMAIILIALIGLLLYLRNQRPED
jgi:hypothetical protein